jgi:uncharacterized protein YbcI
MAVNPVIDDGQEMAAPQGQAISFADTKEPFDADAPTLSMAEQIAQAAIALQQERTGHSPQAATVVLNEDELVVTLLGALSPAEQALAQTSAGAAQVQEFHEQLFTHSCEPLRQEIKRITGVEVREADAEIEPLTGTVIQVFTTGTVVRIFRLAQCVPADAWSANSPVGCS